MYYFKNSTCVINRSSNKRTAKNRFNTSINKLNEVYNVNDQNNKKKKKRYDNLLNQQMEILTRHILVI